MKGNDSTVKSITKHTQTCRYMMQLKKPRQDKLEAQPGCMNFFC